MHGAPEVYSSIAALAVAACERATSWHHAVWQGKVQPHLGKQALALRQPCLLSLAHIRLLLPEEALASHQLLLPASKQAQYSVMAFSNVPRWDAAAARRIMRCAMLELPDCT